MLKEIIRRKIKEKVFDVLAEINIDDTLEKAAENALKTYNIEDTVIENVESIAWEAAIDIIDNDYEDMIYNAVAERFDVSDY